VPNAGKVLLSRAERETLESVCEALLPALAAGDGDDPRLFGLNAAALGIASEVEGAVGELGAGQQADFRRLLRLLAQPAFMFLLAGQARPFAGLPPAARERALLAMATSRLELLRTGFQVLKRLAIFLFYSLCSEGVENPTWPALGYIRSAKLPAVEAALRLTSISAPSRLEPTSA
jgi:hypothetical protein